MADKKNTLSTNLFSLSVDEGKQRAGLRLHRVTAKDRYTDKRYAVERKLFRGFTDLLQKYLKSNPHIDFKHRFNLARPLVYTSPGVRAWANYMPGGFATYHVHSPEVKRLKSGKRVDFLTRRLFRHAVDAIGLRSRAYVLTWLIHDYAAEGGKSKINWLSLASGSGQPVYDTVDSLPKIKFKVEITDRDVESLDFAKTVYGMERPHVDKISFRQLDVTADGQVAERINKLKADVVDAMGLFEYLDEKVAAQLINDVYRALPKGGVFIFTNMSDTNPHLDLHKRGLGWPGVIPRSVDDVATILRQTDVSAEAVDVYAPTDKVYNIYSLTKR